MSAEPITAAETGTAPPQAAPMHSVEQARGTGANAPVIATHPYIGILGVFLGALTATLNGRLMSVGLPDLRGALGAGIDEASWIPTVLNMGLMFMGVFSVFLASVYGVRRILLISGVVFTLTSFLLPFAPTLAILLVLQAIAGLASGSYYSLTLTFVARNLPPKLIIFGVAAYALDIVVTSHLASALEGFYMEHLSWHWIFWTATVLTPIVTLCLYIGVPPLPEAAKSLPKPSWRGIAYLSLGFSIIYGALDQGERLNWLSSGLYVALLSAGILFVLSSVVRRYFQPNPFINLPFLNARNILILGLGIFVIRFSLLASLLVIPSFLGNIQQYRALQTGQTLAWVTAPQFLAVWIVAMAAVFFQPRIVLAAGFATIGIGCTMASRVDSSWAGNSFFSPELVLGAGIAAGFVGLVISLLILAMEMGALTSLANASTFSGCMHTMRLLGGEIGAVTLGHFLSAREQFHSNLLGQHVDAGSWMTTERLGALGAALAPSGMGEAQARSVGLLSAQVRAQAFTMASSDVFLLIAWGIAAYLLLLACMRKSTINLRQMGKTK